MAANPLLASINRAVADNRELRLLFARHIGTAEHPRGRILSIYRNARRSMEQALNGRNAGAAANDVLRELNVQIAIAAQTAVGESVNLGRISANRQAEVYATAGIAFAPARAYPDARPIANSIVIAAQNQIQTVQALMASGATSETIIGDGNRLGALQPFPVQREAARMMRTAVSAGFIAFLVNPNLIAPAPLPFRRQAIAAVDERTTPTCLNVHGQIVETDEDFTLNGTPRYADHMHDPPFHDYCRTSVALYMPEFDEGYTDQMRQAAELEARLRESDNYAPPTLANAFTRIRR